MIGYFIYKSNGINKENSEAINSLPLKDPNVYQASEAELVANDLAHQDSNFSITNNKDSSKTYTNNEYNFQLTFDSEQAKYQTFKDKYGPAQSIYFIFSKEKHPINNLQAGYIFLMVWPKGTYEEFLKANVNGDGPGRFLGANNDYTYTYTVSGGDDLSFDPQMVLKTFKLLK